MQPKETATDAESPTPAGTGTQSSRPETPGDRAERPQVHSKNVVHRMEGQNQIGSMIYNIYGRREHGLQTKLSKAEFKPYDPDRVEAESREIIYDEASMEALAAELIRRRLLLLIGEVGLGKRSMAVALVHRLWAAERLASLLLLPYPPDRGMQVNLRTLLADLGPLDRFLIMPDALDGDNLDLRRFFTSLTQDQLEEIASTLRSRNTFLVLTSSYDALGEQIVQKVRGLHIAQEIPPLPPALLDAGLRRRIESRRSALLLNQPHLGEKIDEMLASAATSAAITSALGTMPRIAEFIDEWLLAVVKEEVTLNQALRRVATLEDWLLFNAERSAEEWSYTLSLVLCYASRAAAPCSWLQFDLVRREVARFLRRELRSSSMPGQRSGVPTLGADEALCRSARAEVRLAQLPRFVP